MTSSAGTASGPQRPRRPAPVPRRRRRAVVEHVHGQRFVDREQGEEHEERARIRARTRVAVDQHPGPDSWAATAAAATTATMRTPRARARGRTSTRAGTRTGVTDGSTAISAGFRQLPRFALSPIRLDCQGISDRTCSVDAMIPACRRPPALERPRLRAGLTVLRRGAETHVHAASQPQTISALDDPEGVWHALLTACDGNRDLAALRAGLADAGHELPARDVRSGIDALADAGFLRRWPARPRRPVGQPARVPRAVRGPGGADGRHAGRRARHERADPRRRRRGLVAGARAGADGRAADRRRRPRRRRAREPHATALHRRRRRHAQDRGARSVAPRAPARPGLSRCRPAGHRPRRPRRAARRRGRGRGLRGPAVLATRWPCSSPAPAWPPVRRTRQPSTRARWCASVRRGSRGVGRRPATAAFSSCATAIPPPGRCRPRRRRGTPGRAGPGSRWPRPSWSRRSPPTEILHLRAGLTPATAGHVAALDLRTLRSFRSRVVAAARLRRVRHENAGRAARPAHRTDDPARGGDGMTLRVTEVKRPRPAIHRLATN